MKKPSRKIALRMVMLNLVGIIPTIIVLWFFGDLPLPQNLVEKLIAIHLIAQTAFLTAFAILCDIVFLISYYILPGEEEK